MVNFAFHSMALREYYTMKHNWSASDITSIWWPVYYQSLVKLPDNDKLRIKKFVNNRLPTLYRKQKYYKRPTGSSYCKKCNLHSETEDHIIRCRSASQQKIRDAWRADILKYLSESHTPTTIRDAICNGFFTWLEMGRNTNHIPKLRTRCTSATKAFNIQSTIGWHHFVRGRMAIEWGNAINEHLAKQTRYSFNAEYWGVHLLTINWQYILKLWTL
jgi:hypothetical protein